MKQINTNNSIVYTLRAKDRNNRGWGGGGEGVGRGCVSCIACLLCQNINLWAASSECLQGVYK